ncbi:hypothetical protein QK704_s2gp1 [Heterobasidion RNA virus 6]|uniref:Uncharacterized protein n=1 Tax=Heterobasidion RNA virus 6 TaxID=980634 RepID=A0A5B8ZU28_9VIRU|nr:hypothetical protein QK704_s2gp1 [Heterobasidion RNA virus 6]QED55787.1 hypothetical protein [Heterobasidion RNA virus 6]
MEDPQGGFSILEMLGAQERPVVDYDAAPLYRRIDLEPNERDTIETIAIKAKKWATIVERGHSLSVALGDIAAGDEPIDYEKKVRQRFTAQEEMLFSAWKKGGRIPDLDKERDKQPVKGGPGAVKRMREAAAALNVILGRSDLSEENAQWYCVNYSTLIPLLKAVVGIARAKRDAAGGQDADPREVAEQRTLTRLVKAESEIVKTFKERVNRLTGAIDSSMSVLQARRSVMARDDTKRGRKQQPYNALRSLMGQATIGRPVDYNKDAAEGRRARNALRGVEPGFTGREPPVGWGAAGPRAAANPYPQQPQAGPSRRRDVSPAYRPRSPSPVDPGFLNRSMAQFDNELRRLDLAGRAASPVEAGEIRGFTPDPPAPPAPPIAQEERMEE